MSEETTETPAVEATTETSTGETTETSYLEGKYNSVSALETGYKELQSSYSKKTQEYNENIKSYAQTTAPENYELAEGIESSSRIEALMSWGKENNLSNDALNNIIATDGEATRIATEAYVAEQKELLGKDSETRLTNVADWAKAQVGQDNMDTFNAMITTAKGVEMMEMLMKNSQGTAPSSIPSKPSYTKEQINEKRFAIDKNSGQRRMSIDPTYRAEVEALEEGLRA